VTNITPFIETRALTHIYNEGASFEKTALDNINLKIEYGECVGIIGHTGSGKSTLIQHLNALLKPTSGQVLVDGLDINADKKALKKIRERIGLVFQYPEHQLFDLTVYKDVSFGPLNMGISKEETDVRVRESLRQVGLSEEFYEKSPFELSGGQKRRAAIAGVLAMRPELLILDEPTAGLDRRGRDEILNHIKALRDEKNRQTIILVTHSMEDIARVTSRLMVMSHGKIVCDGVSAEVFDRKAELLESIGLAVPQIAELARRLREKGVGIPEGVMTSGPAAEALFKLANEKGLI
jgi:energy-coupling factor transport system ATP-binding protein